MPDRISQEQRSYVMSRIKGKGTLPERLVFSYLRKRKIYFQKHYTRVIGNPDVALPRKKKAVFIDGDFWHGFDLERRKEALPQYWAVKITRNIKRDRKYRKHLRMEGWQVLRIWEHELDKKHRDETLKRIYDFLTK